MMSLPFRSSARELYTGRAAAALVPLALVFAGVLLRAAVDPFVGKAPPFIFFVLPVLVAAAWKGLPTALVTTALSVCCGWFLFVVPRYTFVKGTADDASRVIFFTLVSIGIAVLAVKMRQARHVAQRNGQRLELALSAASLSVWEWNPATDDFEWQPSPTATDLLQSSERPYRLAGILDVVHAEDRIAFTSALESAAKTGGFRDVEFRTIGPDGDVQWLSASGMTERAENGEVGRVIGVMADITTRKQNEVAMREASARLGRQNDELQQFTYAAAHDLREPLRVIAVYSDLLGRRLNGHLDSETAVLLQHLSGASRQMESLVDGLLRYATAVHSDEQPSPVNAGAVAQTAVDLLRELIDHLGATIAIDPLPDVLMVQPQLQQVFLNLFANAFKYRHPSRLPAVRVTCEQEDDGCIISVEDNGIGIRPEYHQRIFGIFKRLHRREEVEGAGIGLAVVKRVIEHNNGRIWVESTEGEGSRFRMKLPVLHDDHVSRGVAAVAGTARP